MSDEKETIEYIVAEMRNGPCCWLTPAGIPQHSHDNELFYKFADRIEAAYKRLALPTPEQWTELARQSVEMYDLKRENDRLRAALKPVLEVEMDMYTSNLSMEIAINEANRIYWSSSAKGKGGD